MVGYVKQNFFVRYRSFEGWVHLNQLAEQWLKEEADLRVQGTVKEVVAERFERERLHLKPLPNIRYDTSYFEYRQAAWDGYIEVRGNRYSVPADRFGSDRHLQPVDRADRADILVHQIRQQCNHSAGPARRGSLSRDSVSCMVTHPRDLCHSHCSCHNYPTPGLAWRFECSTRSPLHGNRHCKLSGRLTSLESGTKKI